MKRLPENDELVAKYAAYLKWREENAEALAKAEVLLAEIKAEKDAKAAKALRRENVIPLCRELYNLAYAAGAAQERRAADGNKRVSSALDKLEEIAALLISEGFTTTAWREVTK